MFRSVRGLLTLSFGLILVLTLAIGVSTYLFTQTNKALVKDVIEGNFNGSLLMSQLAIEAQQIRRYEKEYFMYIGNNDKQSKYESEWRESYAKLDEQLSAMRFNRQGIWHPAELNQFQTWLEALKAYRKGFDEVVEQVNAGVLTDTLSANAAIQEAKNKFRVLVDGTKEAAAAKYQSAQTVRQEINHRTEWLTRAMLGIAGVGLVLVLVLFIAIPSLISKPIRRLSKAAVQMSTGLLEQPVPENIGLKDFKGLAETLERMRISQKALIDRFMQKQAA